MVKDVLCCGASTLGELHVTVKGKEVLPVLEQGGELFQALRNGGHGGLHLCRRYRSGSRGVLVVGVLVVLCRWRLPQNFESMLSLPRDYLGGPHNLHRRQQQSLVMDAIAIR